MYDPNQQAVDDANAKNAALQKQIDDYKQMQTDQVNNGPGYVPIAQSTFEQQAGVLPPGFSGVTNAQTGQLLDQYKINPFAGAAGQKLQQEALSTGPSDWAKNALAQQGQEEKTARGNAGLQEQQAQDTAQSQLMRQGGLGGGARTSLARSGARDQLMANQGVANQGIMQRYGINDTDTQRRQALLGTTADAEMQAQQANVGTQTGALSAKATFDANRYNQQMQAWAAKQGADATRAAGSGGGGKK